MPVTIHIPTPLRPYVGGREALEAPAGTVAEILARLVAEHGSLRTHLFNDEGRLRSFVNVYLGDQNIRELQGDATPADDGAEISIVPSIAGGASRSDRRFAPWGGLGRDYGSGPSTSNRFEYLSVHSTGGSVG